ncbi:DMT family transporter [bacterium]|nr:DMT family transporter [bacterium]
MLKNDYFKGVFFICLAALFWSSAGLMIKWVQLPSLQIALFRSLIAGIFLGGYIFFQIKFRKIPFTMYFNKWALITAICYTFTVSLFVMANKLTTSANAVFLQYTSPVTVILVSYFILKERIYFLEIVTVAVCLVGMALFFADEEKSTALIGNIIGMLSGVAFALLQVSVKRSEEHAQAGDVTTDQRVSDLRGVYHLMLGNAMTVVVLFIAITVLMQTSSGGPLAGIAGEEFNLGSNDVLGLLFLGVIQLGCGYLCFAKGVHYISNVEIAIYTLLEPICNPIWTFLGTGEVPGFWAVIGGMLVLGAMMVNSVFGRKR